MLENEPNNGADGTEGTTETETTTRPNGSTVAGTSGTVRLAQPVRRGRAASRPAGPPPEPDPIPVSTPTTVAAVSVELVTAEEAPPEAAGTDAGEETAEETASKRRSRKTTARTPRTRTRSRVRAVDAEDTEPPDQGAPDTVGGAGAAQSAEAAGTDEPHAADPAAVAAVTFQPPMVLFQPPVVESTGTDDSDTAAEEAEETEETPDTDAEETAEERPTRRRRRRGGRRARNRGEDGEGADTDTADGAETAADTADDTGADTAGETGTDSAGAEADSTGTTEEAEEGTGTSRRRRRRRRRSGTEAATEPEPDDPPNTVVRVRPARTERTERPIEDEVQAVRGSTRLEAKRQRRREGREQGRRRPPIITESEFLARRESVKRDLVVRRIGERTQIAVLEDNVLVEHYVDRADHKSYVGNVYLGRVQNVLPSMEAAFVDIGKGRNAVLYAGEVNWDATGLEGQPRRIESVLKSGQSVLVQVTKDPLGHKGARLTSQISLPGRYLVYVPDGSMTGISRKLPDKERARLKQILKKVMPTGAGVIVRTAAEGASEEELERDISRLAKQWESIKRKAKSATAPALLNSEPDLTIRVVRDIFNEDFSSLVVSGDDAWETIREYVDHVAPHLADRLSHWTEERDVFEAYRIDEQIAKALERKVWLPSGGSLIIDRTEAMTVIDVNTGKFTGQGGNLEETVTKNNLEAAEEIVRQLRLRDIGGIIVIDFIDMVLESNRDLVLRRMLECLSRDRTKHQVAEVTSLGLVQMTRKRVGQGLLEAFSHTCEHCNGRGLILHTDLVESRSGGNGGRKKKNKNGNNGADKAANGNNGADKAAAEKAQPEAGTVPQTESAQSAEEGTPGRTARKAKRAAGPPPEQQQDSAPAEPSAEESAAQVAPVQTAEADDDQTETVAERPRRRRTRRKAGVVVSETAVAEAG
ncbi:Rne/Rng family ribonuclease [Thermobifida alba]|uniref:Rne/Rng family ribonuclease n=1 Tax=Thermobifida alba TaxID=53522 RepID=A0ABY4L154_THEAE|nr:Rne/Rng family ribonuclease [Thermobifida alba]UPT21406.1 Rne/Rng family ribonuclease [Thermobifida alba]